MSTTPAGRPPRRQWGRFAIGLSVSLLGGWLFAALYLSAGGRKPVVVVARDVQRYQQIQEGDLATERVAAGDRAVTISGDQLDEVIGQYASTELTPGMILSPRHLVEDRNSLLEGDEARVGALLSPGEAPRNLSGGDPVQLLIVSESTDDDLVDESVLGWVLDVRRPDDRSGDPGDRWVDFVVPSRDQAAEVQAAAHQGRLAVDVVSGQ